jgi:cytochrome b subunit of formate dehydrogenase
VRKALLGLVVALAVVTLASRAFAASPDEACLACHGEAGMKSEAGRSLSVDPVRHHASVHGSLSCTTCHVGIKEYPHPAPARRVRCATCHEEPGIHVPKSVHKALGALACASCHGSAHYIAPAGKEPGRECRSCHEDQVQGYQRSLHGVAHAKGQPAPTCQSCHGSAHQIASSAAATSSTNHAHVAATCGICHGQKFVMQPSGHSTQPFLSYQESVHGRAVAAGSQKAAVCTDCHGAHEILNAADPKSPIFKFNVPRTCGRCHTSVEREFTQSIHGQALARGNWQSPVCTDCHGIHSIQARLDPTSAVSASQLALVTCARCHEGVRIASEFGVASRRSTTYLASYHGLASKLGSQVVANCASCHGSHSILPSNDQRSMTNRANLVKTCGQCHPGVNENFALAQVHINAPLSADTGSVWVRWIRRFYINLIVLVIGGMLLHNLIIWRRKAILQRDAHHRAVTRMSRHQRLQHMALFLSFFVLVITGFALKYPDSWFAEALAMSESVRRWTHRVAGVVIIGVGFYHIVYSALTREGRKLLVDFLPLPKDATDVVSTMRHYLGWAPGKPAFGRFTYAEKAEYWALIWGLIVMAVTGVALWAKISFGNLLPRWWLDVATAIHFYEAVLATLAIFVWHFYQVFLDPDVYPMNWAWWDGKMSLEHYREEHALDAATVQTASAAENSAVPVDEDAETEEAGAAPENPPARDP